MAVEQSAAQSFGTAAPLVLVVESHGPTATMVCRGLVKAGYAVEATACATEAMTDCICAMIAELR